MTISVVLDTTKVQIFKQITTVFVLLDYHRQLFQIPQRYRFSSKSQHNRHTDANSICCFRYHKGTDFQANHNQSSFGYVPTQLFQIPQRYRFSSKSQRKCEKISRRSVVLDTTKVQIFKQITTKSFPITSCFTLFQIPQRYRFSSKSQPGFVRLRTYLVVLDTTKVQIFKQITTCDFIGITERSCFRYHKGTDFQANHN